MRKKRIGMCLGFIFALSIFLCTSAHAGLIYDWFVTNPVQTVDPDEDVFVNATIKNFASSDVNFDLDAAISLAFASSFPSAPYVPKFGPVGMNILAQFNGIVLTPGESFDFVFATLSPLTPAPAGPYFVTGMGLTINGVDDRWKIPHPSCPQCPDITGTVFITVPDSSSPIPEPTTMLLLGSGLIGLAGFRRKFRKS